MLLSGCACLHTHRLTLRHVIWLYSLSVKNAVTYRTGSQPLLVYYIHLPQNVFAHNGEVERPRTGYLRVFSAEAPPWLVGGSLLLCVGILIFSCGDTSPGGLKPPATASLYLNYFCEDPNKIMFPGMSGVRTSTYEHEGCYFSPYKASLEFSLFQALIRVIMSEPTES